MKLQTKVLFILGGTTATVVLALGALSTWILLDRMNEIERLRTSNNVSRAINALGAQIDELHTKTSDWASWDDTYTFLQDQNPQFIKSNVVANTFQTLHLDALALLDTQDRIVLGKAVESKSGTVKDLGPGIRAILQPGSRLLGKEGESHSVAGLIEIDGVPAIVSARPILTSASTGPSRGTLVWVRMVDDHVLETLQRTTRLTLNMLATGDAPDAGDVPMVRAASESTIHGYAVLRDIYGRPLRALQTTETRDIRAAALGSAARMMVGLVATGAFISAIALLLLRRVVLVRLARLERQVQGIGSAENFSGKVDVGGNDELTTLANSMNQMLDSLRGAKQAAEAAARTKSEFLANMSHEIRTPMTAVLGFTDLLLEPGITLQQRQEMVQTIRRNGMHLLQIINDVLDLSKLEAGKAVLEIGECDVGAMMNDIAESMKALATTKGLTFDLRNIGSPPGVIRTDAMRLRQILLNLAGNAVKFTERGGVWIESQTLQTPGGPRLRLAVGDTGIGISAEQQARIFNAFEQADTSTTRKFGGTGLGLAISHRFVEMLGGSLRVCSEIGKGSIFSFDLPALPGRSNTAGALQRMPGGESRLGDSRPLRGVRVLVAEDGHDNQRLISFLLQKVGATVATAENGRIAVEQIESARASAAPYDLVLMDMQMPEMDGYTATRLLRQRGITMPIIALTAHTMEGDRDKCLNAGCNAYLPKPIHAQALVEAIASHVAPRKKDIAA